MSPTTTRPGASAPASWWCMNGGGTTNTRGCAPGCWRSAATPRGHRRDELEQLVGAIAEHEPHRVGKVERGAQHPVHVVGAAVRIAIERNTGERRRECASQRVGKPERALVRVELDHRPGLRN